MRDLLLRTLLEGLTSSAVVLLVVLEVLCFPSVLLAATWLDQHQTQNLALLLRLFHIPVSRFEQIRMKIEMNGEKNQQGQPL